MTKKALIIIDVQNGMFLEGHAVYDGEQLLQNLNGLIAKARASQTPVIYVQHNEPEGLVYGTEWWEIHPAIAPENGDLIIHKKRPDSFYQTPLDEELKKLGVEHVCLAGIQTDYCVDTTCRSAFSHGYSVTLFSDTHTTVDAGDLTAE
jgi:nicotinamidase-related amidase